MNNAAWVKVKVNRCAKFGLGRPSCLAIYEKHTHRWLTDSTKVLCPLSNEIEILIPGDSRSIFSSLDNVKLEFVAETEKSDFIEAVHQLIS